MRLHVSQGWQIEQRDGTSELIIVEIAVKCELEKEREAKRITDE
jgi:hypothetical protein